MAVVIVLLWHGDHEAIAIAMAEGLVASVLPVVASRSAQISCSVMPTSDLWWSELVSAPIGEGLVGVGGGSQPA